MDMRIFRTFRTGSLAVLVALSGLVVAHASAAAVPAVAAVIPHLKLTRALPSPDTTVTSPPENVRLWFSEQADLVATRISVTASNGVAVPMGKPARLPGRDMPITAAFTGPVAPGRYTVTWKTMSKDGHVVNGTYAFTYVAR